MPEPTAQTTTSGGGWLGIFEEELSSDEDLEEGYAGRRRSKRRRAR